MPTRESILRNAKWEGLFGKNSLPFDNQKPGCGPASFVEFFEKNFSTF
jgi:hypothetical protein